MLQRSLMMKVFVTGASGHVGTVVVAELLGAGHEVIGLARSEQAEQRLVEAGAKALHGTLDDLDVLMAGAREVDGVIHLAFKHDLLFRGDMLGAADADLEATRAMAWVLEGTGKPLVGVNGMLHAKPIRVETDVLPSGPRVDSENFIIELAHKHIRSSIVRLAPTVHGPLDNASGFIPSLIRIARAKGFSAYVGEGLNRWPAVHELDAARLFRLAVEGAPAGSRLHAIQDEGIAFKEIAGVIGEELNMPVRGISQDEVQDHFGHMARFVVVDNPASSHITQELLGWKPVELGLLADLRSGHYF
jgi:nucleoside-diphosphate-sugar epimerase